MKALPLAPKALTPGPVPAPPDLDWSYLASLHDALLIVVSIVAAASSHSRISHEGCCSAQLARNGANWAGTLASPCHHI